MFYWSQVPFVRILLLYIVGILAFNFYAANGSRFTLLLFFSIFFFFILKQSQKLLKYRIQGIILNFLLVLLGIFTTFLNQEEITSSLHYAEQENIWIGEIQSLEETSSNYLKCSINLEYILGSDSLFEVNKRPKVLSLIKKNKNTAELSVGDILSFSSKLKSIGQPLNPSEFNQKKYFQNKGMYLMTFIGDFTKLGSKRSLNHFFNRLNAFLKASFINSGIGGKELQTLNAIFLGNKEDLDAELKDAFKNAGAMHILAVSGLHVGIIYMILNTLLNGIHYFRKQKKLAVIILLVFLWLYAGVSGFSPSVQRAALMFSLFAIGQGLNRKPSIYNTIAVSAFLLLVINPSFIYDLSFQLSYSAVIGIVSIYPILNKLGSPRYKLFKYFYDILLVSIAAQLATLPITIYYFHQFPNWFLLTNLIAIPLAFIAVGLCAVVSIFYILFDSDFYFAELLEFILRALNSVVEFVDQLPFTIIDNIWVEPISTLLILLALILVVIHFHFYNIRLILSALTLLVCVFLIEIYTSSKYLGSNEFTVYSFKNKLAVSLRLGSKARVYSYDTLNLYESKIVRNHLHAMEVEKEDYILLNQIKQDDFCLVKEGFAIFQFKNQLIGITEDMSEVDYLSRIGINYLILDGYPPEKWNYKTKIIATTSSIELNNDINISNYYSLRDQGAFRLSL